MRVRPTRFLVWTMVAGGAVAFYMAFQSQPLEVDMATVARGRLTITLREEGQTRVRDRYQVSAPLAGRVLRINLEPGDPVRAGSTILARFLPSSPELLDTRARAEAESRIRTGQAAVNRARVDLDRATAERVHAESEHNRHKQLHRDGLVADDRLELWRMRAETAREAVRSAESGIAVAEAELETARTRLIRAGAVQAAAAEAIPLRSPIDGVILQRLRESEAVVQSGEPLLEVADPDKLEIVSDMLSTDAVQIAEGSPVLIDQWGGDHVLRGIVRRVEPFGFTKISALGVEEQRVNVIVDFEDIREAWEALGDGYRVEIAVVVWDHDDVLKIPNSCLFRQGEDWAVYSVQESGVAALRIVSVGRRNERETQVVDGLAEGERVIMYPGDQLEDGAQVIPRQPSRG